MMKIYSTDIKIRNEIFDKSILASNSSALVLYFVWGFVFLATLVYCFNLYITIMGQTFYDLYGQSRLCLFANHGFNPYKFIGTEIEPVKNFGMIPKFWGTTPWGLLLGNVFYPGTTSFYVSKIIFSLISTFILLCTSVCIFFRVKKISLSLAIFIFFFLVFDTNYAHACLSGNAGGMISCLLLMAFVFVESKPFMSGVLIAFAMVKPQIAIPICLVFLLYKKFYPIFVAAIIDVIAVVWVSVRVNISPVDLFMDFLKLKTGGPGHFDGIFTLLSFYVENRTVALLLSMVFGMLFLLVTYRYLVGKLFYKAYSITCIISVIWCYAFDNDYAVLIAPALLCLWNGLASSDFVEKNYWMFCAFYVYFSALIVRFLTTLFSLGAYSFFNPWWVAKTLYSVGLVLVAVSLLVNKEIRFKMK